MIHQYYFVDAPEVTLHTVQYPIDYVEFQVEQFFTGFLRNSTYFNQLISGELESILVKSPFSSVDECRECIFTVQNNQLHGKINATDPISFSLSQEQTQILKESINSSFESTEYELEFIQQDGTRKQPDSE